MSSLNNNNFNVDVEGGSTSRELPLMTCNVVLQRASITVKPEPKLPQTSEDVEPAQSARTAAAAKVTAAENSCDESRISDSHHMSVSDMDIDVVGSDTDATLTSHKEKKKKKKVGRPATTGLGVGMKERKSKEAEEEHQCLLRKLDKDLLDPIPPKKKAWDMCLEKEARATEEFKVSPTGDILANVLEESVAIFKAANCSAGLKGTFVNRLHKATVRIRAAASVLHDRSHPAAIEPSLKLVSENEALKRKLQALEDEKAAWGRLKELASIPAPSTAEVESPPSPPVRKSRRKRTVTSIPMELDTDSDVPAYVSAGTSQVSRNVVSQETSLPEVSAGLLTQQTPQKPVVSLSQPPTVFRPSLRGNSRAIEPSYPPGLAHDRREPYDWLTSQIDSLLSQRQQLMESNSIAALLPPSFLPLPNVPSPTYSLGCNTCTDTGRSGDRREMEEQEEEKEEEHGCASPSPLPPGSFPTGNSGREEDLGEQNQTCSPKPSPSHCREGCAQKSAAPTTQRSRR